MAFYKNRHSFTLIIKERQNISMRKNIKKTAVSLVLAASLVLTGVSTNQSAQTAQAAAKKTTVKLSKTSAKVKSGKTLKLKVTIKNGKIKSKKFSTSNKSVATVSSKGVVKGALEGKAVVKCVVKYTETGKKKVKSKTLKCNVTVYDTLYPVKEVAQEAAYKTSSESDGLNHDSKDVVTGFANKDNVTLQMKYNDTSNISTKSTTFTPKGGTKKITKKDNGSMRRNLSAQYLQQYEMGTGINLGNTEEAVYGIGTKLDVIAGKDETAYDKSWGQPEITEEYFKQLHSYGINTVRIPVAWSNGDKDDGTYTIDSKLLARVEQLTNWALNQGMYVIINDHWDNQWWGQFGASTKDAAGKKIANATVRANAWKRYERYWTQIANRFKNYSDHVILESANEELGDRLNDKISIYTGYNKASDSEISKWSGGKIKKDASLAGNLTVMEQYETTNKINQKFVDVIRKTGGNNAYRHLLIAGIDTNIVNTCNEVKYTEDKDGDGKKESYTVENPFKMPKDLTCNGKNRLFLSVHYYTPWDFCGDGGAGDYTYEDQAKLRDELSPLEKFSKEGYAIILGECGVCSPMTVTGSISKWFEDTFTMCRQYHIVPVMWETGQFFDRSNGNLKFRDLAEFWNATNVNADGVYASGNTNINLITGKVDVAKVVTEIPSGDPILSWEGIWYKNGGDSAVGSNRYSATPTIGQTKDDFVPASKLIPTVAGDTTEVQFDATGYQMFIKLDYKKYKNPCMVVKFADETLDPANFKNEKEDNVGHIQLGTAGTPSFNDILDINLDDFNGKAIKLNDGGVIVNDATPWISLAFSGRPTITGIYFYDAPAE